MIDSRSDTEPEGIDALVIGGGVAGLWTLHVLLASGYDAWLCENRALGTGQSVQAQGIVHGGGKYALRKVSDLESIRAIREMPDLWRAHHSGNGAAPDLRSARLLSPGCWLWLPRGSWSSRLEAWGLMPLMRHAGVLSCPPVPLPRDQWPAVLRANAVRAYRMQEPVFDTRSVLAALAEPVADRLLAVDDLELEPVREGTDPASGRTVRARGAGGRQFSVKVRCVVCTAGVGNAELIERVGLDPAMMQRRPLRMLLLRGALPPLHGHCIAGGRTRITVTSMEQRDGTQVWQVGGEVAERHAEATDVPAFVRAALSELRTCLPGLDLARVQVSSYAAVRAEARNDALRRPSGVQVRSVAPGLVVAWPTKWAMAPLLAEEVRREVAARVPVPSSTATFSGARGWPRPSIAPFPWEDVEWSPVPSEIAE